MDIGYISIISKPAEKYINKLMSYEMKVNDNHEFITGALDHAMTIKQLLVITS